MRGLRQFPALFAASAALMALALLCGSVRAHAADGTVAVEDVDSAYYDVAKDPGCSHDRESLWVEEYILEGLSTDAPQPWSDGVLEQKRQALLEDAMRFIDDRIAVTLLDEPYRVDKENEGKKALFSDYFSLSVVPDRGLSVFAKQDVPADHLLLQSPLFPAGEFGSEEFQNCWTLGPYLTNPAMWQKMPKALTALGLMVEYKKGASSPLAPYLRLLGDRFSFPSLTSPESPFPASPLAPMQWRKHIMEPWVFYPTLDRISAVDGSKMNELEDLWKALKTSFIEPNLENIPEFKDEDFFNLDTFTIFSEFVRSRSWTRMCPGMDMFNHRVDAAHLLLLHGEAGVADFAPNGVVAGEEVMLSYGSKGASAFFNGYGFIPDALQDIQEDALIYSLSVGPLESAVLLPGQPMNLGTGSMLQMYEKFLFAAGLEKVHQVDGEGRSVVSYRMPFRARAEDTETLLGFMYLWHFVAGEADPEQPQQWGEAKQQNVACALRRLVVTADSSFQEKALAYASARLAKMDAVRSAERRGLTPEQAEAQWPWGELQGLHHEGLLGLLSVLSPTCELELDALERLQLLRSCARIYAMQVEILNSQGLSSHLANPTSDTPLTHFSKVQERGAPQEDGPVTENMRQAFLTYMATSNMRNGNLRGQMHEMRAEAAAQAGVQEALLSKSMYDALAVESLQFYDGVVALYNNAVEKCYDTLRSALLPPDQDLLLPLSAQDVHVTLSAWDAPRSPLSALESCHRLQRERLVVKVLRFTLGTAARALDHTSTLWKGLLDDPAAADDTAQ